LASASTPHQAVDRDIEIEPFARSRRRALECFSIRLDEPERFVVKRPDLHASLVDKPVMESAERYEVR
jgi:hypothetical protein